MSDSIAITSGKGGVGKTTLAVNLSIALKKITSEIFAHIFMFLILNSTQHFYTHFVHVSRIHETRF